MTAGSPAPAARTAGRFVRDRLTLTLYAPFLTWGWFLYSFSPAVPLIGAEQGISRGQAGLHGTALAVGAIVTGLFSSWLALRLGRRLQLAVGCVVVAVGVAMLLAGGALPATLVASFVTAIGGNLLLSAAQPALSVHHGEAGSAAVTEANAMGALVGLLAPLTLGAAVGAGLGWRPAVAVVMVLALASAALVLPMRQDAAMGRGTVHRGAVAEGTTHSRGFSPTFWLFWVAMISGVAVEFATTFWASDLIRDRTDAPEWLAAASVSALLVGMTASRLVVGPMSVHRAPEKILLVGFVVAGLGWVVFWLSTTPWVAAVGLVVAGLGYGTHYPLSIALSLRTSDGRPDQAQALATMGAGAAIAGAPFLLGTLADSFGAHAAFLMVPVLLLIGGTAVGLGIRRVRRARVAAA